MAHGRHDTCGCFPTGLPYPGIAEQMRSAAPEKVGLAEDLPVDAAWRSVPIAVIDTETTGKDPGRGDRVVEVGVVRFVDGAVVDRFGTLINPGVPIPAEASAVHGIKDADVKGAPSFEAVAPRLKELLSGAVPAAYNAGFDRSFIRAEMRRAGHGAGKGAGFPPALRVTCDWIDPLVWARALQSGSKGFKLGEVAARLGVSLSNAHRATDDAEAAGHVLLALLKDEPALTYRGLIARQRGYTAANPSRGPWRR